MDRRGQAGRYRAQLNIKKVNRMAELSTLSADQLKDWLQDGQELALLDVSEALHYGRGHIVAARHQPLSLLELQAPGLLPRRDVRIVLCSADGDVAAAWQQVQRAAAILARLGCSQLWALEGGLLAWPAQGGLLVDGYGTLLKAFGEHVRQHYGVPALAPALLQQRLQQGLPTTVVDVRTPAEHRFSTLPGAVSYPGTEWPLRDLAAHADAQDPEHLWAVTCFSRTRGVIGTATLRALYGPDVPVAWVDDGVMAWVVQGRDDVHGPAEQAELLPPLSSSAAQAHATHLIARHGLARIDAATLAQWQVGGQRTVQVFDLRPGARSRPGITAVAGGQLFMHLENHALVRHARLVLLDEPHQLRAAVIAFWLQQLGEVEVFIYDGPADEAQGVQPASGQEDASAAGIHAEALAALLARGQTQVLDVGPSIDYVQGHIANAWYANAAAHKALCHAFEEATAAGKSLVLTSPDGAQACLVARDLAQALGAPVTWLQEGLQGWRAAGLPLETAHAPAQLRTEFLDDWGSILRVPQAERLPAWERYLHWERNLAQRLQGDPGVRFRLFDTVG